MVENVIFFDAESRPGGSKIERESTRNRAESVPGALGEDVGHQKDSQKSPKSLLKHNEKNVLFGAFLKPFLINFCPAKRT